MANGRSNKGRKSDSGRDPGGFVALPWSVLDSAAYAGLSHPSRALLLEIARQFVRDNNGRLLASAAYLSKRGWNSADVITRAKRELLEAGLIHETVKGHRPNKASWYAVTWRALDRLPGYDVGAAETFRRGAYQDHQPLKNASLRPSAGVESPSIAPSHGTGRALPTPSSGAIRPTFAPFSTPSHGNHLEMPSEATVVGEAKGEALHFPTAVGQPHQPSADGSANAAQGEQFAAMSDSSAQHDPDSITSWDLLGEDGSDLLNSLYVIRYIEEQERAERVKRMKPWEVDEFGYTKAMYEDEARQIEELSKLFPPRRG